MTTSVVPVLPCVDVAATVAFYEGLGFTVLDRQTRPYLYVALALDDVQLHFKDPPPHLVPSAELSGGAVVFVDDVAPFHQRFVDNLRGHGRVPLVGLPRLARLRRGQTRFNVYDPNGNCLVFVNRDEPEIEYGGSTALSGLAKAHDNARIFRDFKDDDVLAARALDTALRRHGATAPRVDVARALADRAELAVVLGERDLAEQLRGERAALRLTDDERGLVAVELEALEQIEQWVS